MLITAAPRLDRRRRSASADAAQVISGGSGTLSARAPGQTPAMPTPLAGAAATEAVAVPWAIVDRVGRGRRDVAADELRVRGVELRVDERDQRARRGHRRDRQRRVGDHRAPVVGRGGQRVVGRGQRHPERVRLRVHEQVPLLERGGEGAGLTAGERVAAGAARPDVPRAEARGQRLRRRARPGADDPGRVVGATPRPRSASPGSDIGGSTAAAAAAGAAKRAAAAAARRGAFIESRVDALLSGG